MKLPPMIIRWIPPYWEKRLIDNTFAYVGQRPGYAEIMSDGHLTFIPIEVGKSFK